MQDIKAKALMSVSNKAAAPELPIIQQGENLLISAILLHRKLKVKTVFSNWIQRRIEKYGFEINQDFFPNLEKSTGGRKSTDYLLTIDTAKELAMLEENEIGRSIRRYFIQKEKESRIGILPREASLFKGIKAKNINNRRMYPYKAFLREKAGYSSKSSGYHYRRAYAGHFVVMDGITLISEELALLIFKSRQLAAARLEAKAMQPVLPFNFGAPLLNQGGTSC